MLYDKENSLAFFLKKGNNTKLLGDRTLQCNSDAEQFAKFNSLDTDKEITEFLSFLTLVNLKEFLIKNEANVTSSKCRRVFKDVPAFMLRILEHHNRVDTSIVGQEYYGLRINCSKCKTIKVMGHICTPKEECINYVSDTRTHAFSKFKQDFGHKNPTLFDLIEKAVATSTKGEENCKKSFVGFPRLQAHLVLAYASVHIGHEDHLNMFMEAPKCAKCNSQKLFGLCSCSDKWPKEMSAKTKAKRFKKVSESEVVLKSLDEETVLNPLQNMIESQSEQSVETNDGQEEINNNSKSFVPVVDADNPCYKTWNEQTYLDVMKNQLMFAGNALMYMHSTKTAGMTSIKGQSL